MLTVNAVLRNTKHALCTFLGEAYVLEICMHTLTFQLTVCLSVFLSLSIMSHYVALVSLEFTMLTSISQRSTYFYQ